MGDPGDEIEADRVPAILGPRDGFAVDAELLGQLFLGQAAPPTGLADALADLSTVLSDPLRLIIFRHP
ncbi:hypothetical protein OG455_41095 [Kitasatospora sp. NBC_01287]|nr:hypothetical protein [Kitasatospora sp. NBC_01287]MCX4750879.1 hypothetical protein [Kitasatospora sp. NBC_01287]MCX4751838.1 hypothetical protein [Kitasatospora sp. NBC_01287]